MKTVFLTLIAVVGVCLQMSAQNCPQDENVKRFMARGNAALKTAEKPEDYKLAAEEFAKALEYAPKCPNIHYSLALCYEKMGTLDPGNYNKAISYLNSYLALNSDVANKDEVQNKIYEIEFLLEKAGGIGLKDLVGKWKFYYGDGSSNEYYDITITENYGVYYVIYLQKYWNTKYYFEQGGHLVEGDDPGKHFNKKDNTNSAKLTYNNNLFTFTTDFILTAGEVYKSNQWICKYTNMKRYYYDFDFEVKYQNGKLMGKRNITYKKVESMVGCDNNWRQNMECNDNCGIEYIYFIKQ
jgi:tetratricopeptide (TPR) repeat protein